MKQEINPDLLEFRGLMAAIRKESTPLQKAVLSKEEEEEENEILRKFDRAIQDQTLGTLSHLVLYQLRGWRELTDE